MMKSSRDNAMGMKTNKNASAMPPVAGFGLLMLIFFDVSILASMVGVNTTVGAMKLCSTGWPFCSTIYPFASVSINSPVIVDVPPGL